MTEATLSTATGAMPAPPAFPQAARACAVKVAIGLLVVASALAGLGLAIEHSVAVGAAWSATWDVVFWVLSLGGHFWGAVAVGFTAMGVIAWAMCVDSQLAKKTGSCFDPSLVWTAIGASALWLCAFLAMHSLFTSFDALNAYRKIGVIALNLPVLVPLGVLVLAGFAAMVDDFLQCAK